MIRILFLISMVVVTSTAQALSVVINEVYHDICGRGGRVQGYVSGGVGPYQLVWSSGQVQTTGFDINLDGLSAGEYTITVTDANAEQIVSDPIAVLEYGLFPEVFSTPFPNCGQPMSILYPFMEGYELQYPLDFVDQDVEQIALDGDLCSNGATLLRFASIENTYRTMFYTDAGGCPGSIRTLVPDLSDLPSLQVVDVQASCSNIPSGSCRVMTSGSAGSSALGDFTLQLYRANGEPVPTFCQNGANGILDKKFTDLTAGTYYARLQGAPPFLTSPEWSALESLGWSSGCREEVQIVIPSNGQTCGRVQGSVYIDANADCARQTAESRVPGTTVQILPGPYYAVTGPLAAPSYSLALPVGNYTISEQGSSVEQGCGGAPLPFTVTAGTVTVDVPATSIVPLDVQLRMSSGAARPGFELQYGLALRNLTPTSSGNITLTMQLDPALGYIAATPAPTSVVGSTLSWNQNALTGYQQRSITVRTQVPADVSLLGTDLVSTAAVSSVITDGNLVNNTAVNIRTVTGSYDPNDKLAYASGGSTTLYDPSQDEWIDYTIRFQNTGSDTAFNVIITDTLVAELDPGSIEIGAASHGFTWAFVGQRAIKFWLLNLQLPHSAINEPGSHGFVSFRIKPRSPLTPGTQLINRANIFFDFNPPIITEPSVLTVPTPPVLLSPRMYLGGAFSVASPTMSASLRTMPRFPRVEPYSAMGYVHSGTGGGEVVSPAAMLMTGNNAIVDWVVVELREAAGSGAVVASRAALLQRDGDVVANNGSSPVAFYVPSGTTYRIAVRHRNHLGVMTATPRTLSTTPTSVDFGLNTTTTYGTNARNMINGTMVLWPGDVNDDGAVKYAGSANDRDEVLVGIGGIVPTNVVNNVYDPRDVNLDGNISYTGSNNDRDVILQAIGGVVPTAVRTQQLP